MTWSAFLSVCPVSFWRPRKIAGNPSGSHVTFLRDVRNKQKGVWMSTINSKTTAGLFEFCDFMVEKGYATTAATDPWKTAARKMLGTVFGEEFEGTDLTSLDFDDVTTRFETLTRGQYKHESVLTYARRLKNAVDAYLEYLDTGKPPQLRRSSATTKPEPKKASSSSSAPKLKQPKQQQEPMGDLVKFPFPLKGGEMAQLHLPRRLQRDDADRLSAFLRTLQIEPQKEIPRRTGEEAEAA
jgi:hypothetical protein